MEPPLPELPPPLPPKTLSPGANHAEVAAWVGYTYVPPLAAFLRDMALSARRQAVAAETLAQRVLRGSGS